MSMDFGLEGWGNERVRIAASWDIAARLVGIDPESRIYEYHPHGGMYDCLAVGRRGLHIDINRNGGIHVHQSPVGEAMSLIGADEWVARATRLSGTREIVSEVAAAAGLDDHKAPSGQPWPVTYRVIARTLASKIFDAHTWDCRLQIDDSSGHYSAPKPRFAAPSPDAFGVPQTELWAVFRDGSPVAYLWNGWTWNAIGERINLAARFARGDSIDALSRELLNRSGLKATSKLPDVDIVWRPVDGDKPPMF